MKPFGGGRLFDIGLCFKFLRLYPEVVTVAGMQSLEELSQNIGYAGNDDVPDSNDRKKIKEIYDELGTRFCRECWYCMPCAKKKIEIPTINFIEVFYKQFPEEEFWNMDLDKKVDAARQCTECGKCSEKCPFELDVPQIIRHNIAFYDSLKNKK
jgi:predicted aldo/keto reductase-like oxidoreductase